MSLTNARAHNRHASRLPAPHLHLSSSRSLPLRDSFESRQINFVEPARAFHYRVCIPAEREKAEPRANKRTTRWKAIPRAIFSPRLSRASTTPTLARSPPFLLSPSPSFHRLIEKLCLFLRGPTAPFSQTAFPNFSASLTVVPKKSSEQDSSRKGKFCGIDDQNLLEVFRERFTTVGDGEKGRADATRTLSA